jgi:hypothetical protein
VNAVLPFSLPVEFTGDFSLIPRLSGGAMLGKQNGLANLYAKQLERETAVHRTGVQFRHAHRQRVAECLIGRAERAPISRPRTGPGRQHD